MELLIRSQSKMSLVDGKNLVMFNMDENWLICKLNSSLDTNYRIELGTYATKERALEVLDEIQNFIERKDIKGNRYYDGKIYEMPQE